MELEVIKNKVSQLNARIMRIFLYHTVHKDSRLRPPTKRESRVRYVDVGVSDNLSMELDVNTEQGVSI